MATVDPSTCKVALLAGGTSGEREISLESAKGARAALEEAGFVVTQLDPAEKEDLRRLMDEEFDVAFICLHGKGGEDGTIQGYLELLGIPYTGSGVLASAICMDKARAKMIYEQVGLFSPRSVALTSLEDVDAARIADIVGLPCVVKPATEGSALGVTIANTVEEVAEAFEKAFAIDKTVLAERYIQGTEITVAVLGNETTKALPAIEIVPTNEFYDYESKYAPGGSEHICPATLPEEKLAQVQYAARLAHETLGCRGMSRSDFIVDNNGGVWILETNTIPGMTSTSLLPDAARVSGLKFPALCTKLIEFALE